MLLRKGLKKKKKQSQQKETLIRNEFHRRDRERESYGKSISKRVFPSLRAKSSEFAASVTRTSYDFGLYTATPAFAATSELFFVFSVVVVVEAFSSFLTLRICLNLGFGVLGWAWLWEKLGWEQRLLLVRLWVFAGVNAIVGIVAIVTVRREKEEKERERERFWWRENSPQLLNWITNLKLKFNPFSIFVFLLFGPYSFIEL